MTQIKGSLNRAIEALEFYAEKDNHTVRPAAKPNIPMKDDLGEMARHALADLRALKEELPDNLQEALKVWAQTDGINWTDKTIEEAAKPMSEATEQCT